MRVWWYFHGEGVREVLGVLLVGVLALLFLAAGYPYAW